MKKNILTTFWNSYKTISIITLVVCVLVSFQCILLGGKGFGNGVYTHYNNYVIFKYSFFHLIHHQDLYQLFLTEHWDLYKYSPTFALCFGLFAYLPDWLGVVGWNVLNGAIMIWAVKNMPGMSEKSKAFVLWFVLVELVGSQQNTQSNALLAGLVIGAFVLAEQGKFLWSMLLIVCSGYLKIYGLLGMVMYLFYPQKIRNAAYFLFWGVLLFVLPLVVVSWAQLIFLYKSWGAMLSMDHSVSVGLSVAGWLTSWFHLYINKDILLIVGLVLFLLPLLRMRQYQKIQFRAWVLASSLIWMVIFNHKAESPTFIIAVAGVALWYVFQSAPMWWHKVLATLVFIFTMLSPTDIFPGFIQDNYFDPYVIKVVPCIWVWAVLTRQLLFMGKEEVAALKTGMTT